MDDGKALLFIEEWYGESDYVTAHTSGSTGTPKEIQLPKSLMRASAQSTNKFFGIDENSLLLSPLSAEFIAGKMMIVRAIESKSKLIVESPSNQPMAKDYGTIDLLPVVPSQIEWLLNNPQRLSKVRNLLIGGAAPKQSDEIALMSQGVNAWISYGMTETCSHVALRKILDDKYSALPGIEFQQDERGCLEISREGFEDVITNDIVELINEREFRWLGRYDNVINSGGIKVFPELIEQKIARIIPQGVSYYIGKGTNARWGEVPVLYLENIEATIADEILAKCRVALEGAERPNEVKIVAKFNRTANGKLRR